MLHLNTRQSPALRKVNGHRSKHSMQLTTLTDRYRQPVGNLQLGYQSHASDPKDLQGLFHAMQIPDVATLNYVALFFGVSSSSNQERKILLDISCYEISHLQSHASVKDPAVLKHMRALCTTECYHMEHVAMSQKRSRTPYNAPTLIQDLQVRFLGRAADGGKLHSTLAG